jgi:hypothetical protein
MAGREGSGAQDHARPSRKNEPQRQRHRRSGPGRLDTRKGTRPSFIKAAPPEKATRLFDYFCERIHSAGVATVEKGRFGAMMDVHLINDGPVTIVLERDPEKENQG